MQSQRPLYARERVRARARCTHFFFSFSTPRTLFFLSHRCVRCVLVLCDAYARTTCTRPPRSFFARSCCSTCAYGVQRTRKRRALKLSRWFAVCIAWRRRVMRAGVRIYGRCCSRKRGSMEREGTPRFFARYARDKKSSVIFLHERETSVALRVMSQNRSAFEHPGATFFIRPLPSQYLLRYIDLENVSERITSDIGTQWKITTMSEKIWRRTRRGT